MYCKHLAIECDEKQDLLLLKLKKKISDLVKLESLPT